MKARILDPCLLLVFRSIRLILARTAYKFRKLDPAFAIHVLVHHQAVHAHRVKVSVEVEHLVRIHFCDLYRDLFFNQALTFALNIFLREVDQDFIIKCLLVAYHIRHSCAQRHDHIDLLRVS